MNKISQEPKRGLTMRIHKMEHYGKPGDFSMIRVSEELNRDSDPPFYPAEYQGLPCRVDPDTWMVYRRQEVNGDPQVKERVKMGTIVH